MFDFVTIGFLIGTFIYHLCYDISITKYSGKWLGRLRKMNKINNDVVKVQIRKLCNDYRMILKEGKCQRKHLYLVPISLVRDAQKWIDDVNDKNALIEKEILVLKKKQKLNREKFLESIKAWEV